MDQLSIGHQAVTDADADLDVFKKFVSYLEEKDISAENVKYDSTRGNFNVKLLDSLVFRIRCTDENIGIHVPVAAGAYFANTGFQNVSVLDDKKLTGTWKCYSFARADFGEDVYFAIFCVFLDKLKRAGRTSIGCCHLYRQCSDLRRCVIDTSQPRGKETKRDCIYRMNLLQGRVFYGVNALADLDDGERELLKAYRYSDPHGKKLIREVVEALNSQELDRQLARMLKDGISVCDIPDESRLKEHMRPAKAQGCEDNE